MHNLRSFWSFLYGKLFRINDTPQKVALGLGIGAFSGITPGIGILTALFLAVLLKANRAAALLGTLVTNTWLSFATFILSIKVGSAILGTDWQDVHREWLSLLKDFRPAKLLTLSALNIALPVAVGYLAISVCFGLLTYAVALVALSARRRHEGKGRADLPSGTER